MVTSRLSLHPQLVNISSIDKIVNVNMCNLFRFILCSVSILYCNCLKSQLLLFIYIYLYFHDIELLFSHHLDCEMTRRMCRIDIHKM